MRALWSGRPNCSHNVSQKVKRIRRFSESCRVTEIRIISCPSKKEFSALPISVICVGVVPARKIISEAPFFDSLTF